MESLPPTSNVVRFGVFEVDLRTGELRKSGVKLKLQEQPLQILITLLARPSQVVTREELREKLWDADTFVNFEHSLGTAINKIREALGDSAENPRFLETVPRRGYRFIAPVSHDGEPTGVESPVAAPAPSLRLSKSTLPYGLAFLATAAAALTVMLAFDWGHLRQRLWDAASAPRIGSVAVLPLHNLSHDPEQEYFSDGMTDELITDLAKVGSLRVISHTSVERYKETKRTLPEIARELGVDAVVEGTVMRSGDHVRITAQLIDARSDRHLWAETYERNQRDVLALQAEVSRDIATQVKVKLTPQEQARLSNARSIAPETYEAYLKGNFYFEKMSIPGFQEGLKFYQEAITREPDYAPAYVGLAKCYENLGLWGALPPRQAGPQAKPVVEKALAIDDTLGEAHASLAHIHFTYDWDWAGAEREFKRALELSPSSAISRVQYSTYLSAMGRHDEALAQIKEAHALDPVSHITNGLLGAVYFWAHRFDEAIDQFQKTLVLYPDAAADHQHLGLCYEQKRMYGEAVEEYLKEKELYGVSREELSVFRQAFASSGMKGFLRADLKLTIARSKRRYVRPLEVAQLYARLGENDKAFEWLEKAYQERGQGIAYMKVEPSLDGLHSDPRFQELLRRLGLPN
jgi:TolB-like protein/DNA-binding winged helix-turn-helix (wHTH) protein